MGIHFSTIDSELKSRAKMSIYTSFQSLSFTIFGKCFKSFLLNFYYFWEHLEVKSSKCQKYKIEFYIHFLTIDFELNYDAKSSIDTSWESLFDNVLGECLPTLLPNSYDFWEHLEVTTSKC